MSMPMICDAACRASSGDFASLMPPALPRPPTGTCALTATGPSSAQACAACSGVRATLPGGMGMPREASTSLAWYSRNFKSVLERSRSCCGRRFGKRTGQVGAAVRPTVAEGVLKVGVAEHEHREGDADHEHHHRNERAPDQHHRPDRALPGCLSAIWCGHRRALNPEWSPGGAVPVEQAVIRYPPALRILSRHA